MDLRQFQKHIGEIYGEKDRTRGIEGTFMYLVEEIGELATALKEENKEDQAGEFADVVAWTMSLAELAGVDVAEALKKKYANCRGCQSIPCTCATKP